MPLFFFLNKHVFRALLKAKKSDIWLPAWLCLMKALLPVCRQLPSHCVLTCQKEEALASLPLSFLILFTWLHQAFTAACGIFSYSVRTHSCGLWDLILWPGIQPRLSALGIQSLSPWTTKDVPFSNSLKNNFHSKSQITMDSIIIYIF